MPLIGSQTLGTENGVQVAKRRLQTLADSLAALDLEQEVDQAARLLRAELPDLPDYPALDAAHQMYYDIATGLRAATALLSPAILRANEGVAKLKTPEFEYTFIVPSLTEREGWAAEIEQAVGYLVKLVQSLTPPRRRQHFSMFGAAGVARQRARREYSLGGIMRLYVPGDWFYDGAFTIIGPDFITDSAFDSPLPDDFAPGMYPGDCSLDGEG